MKHNKNYGKLLVIRGRSSKGKTRSRSNQNKLNQDMDKGSMRKTSRTTDGWLSDRRARDFISPLIRFLKANCGRPWDDIFSELMEDNTQDLNAHHLQQHIEGMVYYSMEELLCRRYYYHINQGFDNPVFVVDRHGILQDLQRKTRKNYTRTTSPYYKYIDSKLYIKDHLGAWYEVLPYSRVSELGLESQTCFVLMDDGYHKVQNSQEMRLLKGDTVKEIIWRYGFDTAIINRLLRQLNSREIKNLNLNQIRAT